MARPLVTLTTDFGEGSPYVAALKGSLLAICPDAEFIDLSHRLPPQDLRHASFFLRAALPYFAPGILHLIVVDPGVGTERALLFVESAGQRLLVPDNGIWTVFADLAGEPPRVRRLEERRYWRPETSATFHGRDILAPVAGHLCNGVGPEQLGPLVHEWVCLPFPRPVLEQNVLTGEIVFIDSFGNLISNLPGSAYRAWVDQPARVSIDGQEIPRLVRTYGDAEAGSLIALTSSVDTLEIAVAQGNAAARLGAKVGSSVCLERKMPLAS